VCIVTVNIVLLFTGLYYCKLHHNKSPVGSSPRNVYINLYLTVHHFFCVNSSPVNWTKCHAQENVVYKYTYTLKFVVSDVSDIWNIVRKKYRYRN